MSGLGEDHPLKKFEETDKQVFYRTVSKATVYPGGVLSGWGHKSGKKETSKWDSIYGKDTGFAAQTIDGAHMFAAEMSQKKENKDGYIILKILKPRGVPYVNALKHRDKKEFAKALAFDNAERQLNFERDNKPPRARVKDTPDFRRRVQEDTTRYLRHIVGQNEEIMFHAPKKSLVTIEKEIHFDRTNKPDGKFEVKGRDNPKEAGYSEGDVFAIRKGLLNWVAFKADKTREVDKTIKPHPPVKQPRGPRTEQKIEK